MRLSQIKLAGFKSFVDPTVLHFPTNLTGVVGPNGCGKSNVIDAVRWVMGESSAKYLRGDSLADVIFNGSSARKPVGVASIELVFDNADGAIGGPYAKFAEVSVKRTLSRDGISSYFINGTRCRRRDITGIFLGTGLGPRSYSIIEQGMVSRLIEARPEDMRAYLEEAAGISRYKERRRETENRIRHTRENLERLTDLRDEVDKQLKHLQRQARVAERYKEYRQRERQLQAELTLLRLRDLDAAHQEQHQRVEKRKVEVDAALAAQRAVENRIESARESLAERQEAMRVVQERFYKHGAEIARIEQEIAHARELRDGQTRELERLRAVMNEVEGDIAADRAQLDAASRELETLLPKLQETRGREESSAAAMEAAQGELAQWQQAWDAWTAEANAARQTVNVEDTRLGELDIRSGAVTARLGKLEQARAALSLAELEDELAAAVRAAEDGAAALAARRSELEACVQRLEALRGEDRKLSEELHQVRQGLEQVNGRVASLEALQQAALNAGEEGEGQGWLRARGLADRARLAQLLQVEPGWEAAVEMVLANSLEAVCVDDIEAVLAGAPLPEGARVTLYRAGRLWSSPPSTLPLAPLLTRLRGDTRPDSLLAGVYCADTLEEALRHVGSLEPGQSIITRAGQWLGPDWLQVGDRADAHAGVIEREQTLREARGEQTRLVRRREELQQAHDGVRARLAEEEAERAACQEAVNRGHTALAESRSRQEALSRSLEQSRRQLNSLENESGELREQEESIRAAIEQSRQRAAAARETLQTLQAREDELRERRARLSSTFEGARERAGQDRAEAQALALQVESRTSQQKSLQEAMQRLQSQLRQYEGRRDELAEQLEETVAPIADMEQALESRLQERGGLERELAHASEQVESANADQRKLQAERGGHETAVSEAREALDQQRLILQEIITRRSTCAEQLERTGVSAEEIAQGMAEEASIAAWEEELEGLERRIQRLGPINLAAIDEFQTQSERKEYLDSQHADLTEALETLETAMRKIDRETRTRFKETYDQVDAGLKRIFPRLFGGGHAYLELSDDDLLAAGVTVMARPPGKRNSTIHLLSGGEKAMTAVALIFAIFELNPAPFCMLDEVDAPLDDANVSRFCEIVKEMSERVQFVFITHNKMTMELASHLSGVTMQEPGVSRLVAVDVDEAVRLAAM